MNHSPLAQSKMMKGRASRLSSSAEHRYSSHLVRLLLSTLQGRTPCTGVPVPARFGLGMRLGLPVPGCGLAEHKVPRARFGCSDGMLRSRQVSCAGRRRGEAAGARRACCCLSLGIANLRCRARVRWRRRAVRRRPTIHSLSQVVLAKANGPRSVACLEFRFDGR